LVGDGGGAGSTFIGAVDGGAGFGEDDGLGRGAVVEEALALAGETLGAFGVCCLGELSAEREEAGGEGDDEARSSTGEDRFGSDLTISSFVGVEVTEIRVSCCDGSD